jgi:multidrug efflux pump subunit AcrA (membrane-fusion protein)
MAPMSRQTNAARLWAAALAAMLVIIAVTGLAARRPADARAPAALAEATTGTVTRIEPVAGTVASRAEASVTYAGPPTTVSTVPVNTGATVGSGATLATLANGTTLTAPFAGQVVEVTLSAGAAVPAGSSAVSLPVPASSAGAGAFLGRGGGPQLSGRAETVSGAATDAVTIAAVKAVDVQATVFEQDIHWIRVGQSVRMILPGEPGQIYHGTVTEVSGVPTSGAGGSVVFPITISINTAGHPVPFLGMSVQAFITVATSHGVTVPVDALHENGRGQFTVTLANGQVVPVGVGLVGLNRAVVTGIRAGQWVRVPRLTGTPSRRVTVLVLPSFSSFPSGFGRLGF